MTHERAGEEGHDRRRIGLVVAAIPLALFLLSGVFIALRGPAAPPGACRHDHPTEEVRRWWQEARQQEVAVRGTRYLTLDESEDGGPACIRVGLEEPRVQTHLERRFRRLGVPGEVVVYEPADATGEDPS